MTLKQLKDYWWVLVVAGGTVFGAVKLWGTLPDRVLAVEQDVEDLKGVAKQLEGYTEAQQEWNRQQQQLMLYLIRDGGSAPISPPEAPARVTPSVPPEALRSPDGLWWWDSVTGTWRPVSGP